MVPATMRHPAPGGADGTLTRLFWASYPGVPEAVTAARHHITQVLAGVPCAEDVAYAVSEVGANAVMHSRSGQPGGWFTVAADVLPGVLGRSRGHRPGRPVGRARRRHLSARPGDRRRDGHRGPRRRRR
jgi:anti-sigma regulatory factor (Ser/Thr protein kinase)